MTRYHIQKILKAPPKKLLELINEFSNVARYKINVKKPVAFLYTTNGLLEKKFQKTIPFTVASKTTKYLGIRSSKEVKDLYIENYNTLFERN